MATLLVTAAVSFSANGADAVVAQSNASAVTATGLTGIVDTEQCAAESTGEGAPADGEGLCGDGLSTQGVSAFSQNASTDLDGDKGTSTADASVAPIDTPSLTTIDLGTIGADIAPDAVNTGTILDNIIDALDPVTGALFEAALTPILQAVQSAVLDPVLDQLTGVLDVKLDIKAVNSQCSAKAGENATGSSDVAGIDIVVTLPGGNDVVLPFDLGAKAPNSALVGPSVQDLVDGVLDGLEDSLNTSLNGVLGPLAAIVPTIKDQLIDPILDQVEAALLNPLGEALAPVVTGTVNKQVVGDNGQSIEVTALSLNVLSGTATADLARSTCGPNGLAVVADDTDTQADVDVDADADADVDADANADADADAVADADADADADAAADADSAADADVTTSLPNTGASANLLPFWLLGLALVAFGGAVLVNERRRTL